jgi:hypothetical protein
MGLEGAFVQKLTVSGSIIGNNRKPKKYTTRGENCVSV